MEMFMSEPPLSAAGSEVSTVLSRFVSDSCVVQIRRRMEALRGC